MSQPHSERIRSEEIIAEILGDPELQGIDRKVLQERLRFAAVTHLSDEEVVQRYLERYRQLPDGAKLYQITNSGRVFVAGDDRIEEIRQDNPAFHSSLHQFINDGNLAHYLLGNPQTSESNPQNATFKMGVTKPHHSFTPHAHGSRHFVTSMGYSGCLLFDKEHENTLPIKLLPGSIIDIPGHLPHAFYNRSNQPLITVICNAGLGIEHEDYAITREMAQDRLAKLAPDENPQEIAALIRALQILEDDFSTAQPQFDTPPDEKLARVLYRIAERLGMSDHK